MKKYRILLVRFSSLGDLFLNSSVFSALRQAYGEQIELELLTSSEFSSLFADHPFITQVHGLSRKLSLKDLIKAVRELHREKPFDLFIDLHNSLRSFALRFFLPGLPRINVDKRTFERNLLTTFKINWLSRQGVDADQRKERFGEALLLRTIRDFSYPLGISGQREKISNFLSEKLGYPYHSVSSCSASFLPLNQLDETKNQWGLLKDKKIISLAPSASFVEKRWPVAHFLSFLKMALVHPEFKDFYFVIFAGPSDDFCQAFDSLQSGRVINLQGRTSLLETALWQKHAQFCVGNDTGVPHMAEAVGRPSLFIMGPTGEEFGFYGHHPQSLAVKRRLWCRPCTTNGKGHCVRSQRFCLTQITPTMVLEEAIKLKRSLS